MLCDNIVSVVMRGTNEQFDNAGDPGVHHAHLSVREAWDWTNIWPLSGAIEK